MASVTASYKHLDAKLRIGEFSFAQWGFLATGVLAALGYALYLHPLGTYFTLATAVYVAGIPFVLSVLASTFELSLGRLARSIWSWWRRPAVYAAGPDRPTPGYVVTAPAPERRADELEAIEPIDVGGLWA